jgi:hypothetical protein
LGASIGLRVALVGDFGVLTELGVLAHHFSHPVELDAASRFVGIGALEPKTHIDISLLQGVLSLGAYC